MLEHHLEPLFFINDTFDTVYVKMNSNFPTFWLRSDVRETDIVFLSFVLTLLYQFFFRSQAKNQTWKERSVPISKINLKNCSEIPLELREFSENSSKERLLTRNVDAAELLCR